MPVKRNSFGRFEKFIPDDETEPIIKLPRGWGFKTIGLLLLALFLISPWIVMIVKNNTLSLFQEKVTDFYEEVFSYSCPPCNPTCPIDDIIKNEKDKKSL